MGCKLCLPTQLGVVHGRPKFSVIKENLVTATIKHNHKKRPFLWFILQCCHYLTTALMVGQVTK